MRYCHISPKVSSICFNMEFTKEELVKEEWRDIDDYEGKYQISNLGRLRSFVRSTEPRIIAPHYDKDGYIMYYLFRDGKSHVKKAHRLVAVAFIPNNDNLPQINHKDEDKTNNRASNLEWCTLLYNNRYGTKRQRMSLYAMYKGHFLRRIRQYTKDGLFVKEHISSRMAERETNIKHQNIIETCRGGQRQSGGYLWCYADDIQRIKEIESLRQYDNRDSTPTAEAVT